MSSNLYTLHSPREAIAQLVVTVTETHPLERQLPWLNPIFDAIVATEICAMYHVPVSNSCWAGGAFTVGRELGGSVKNLTLCSKPKTTRVSDPRIEQVTPLWFDSVDFFTFFFYFLFPNSFPNSSLPLCICPFLFFLIEPLLLTSLGLFSHTNE